MLLKKFEQKIYELQSAVKESTEDESLEIKEIRVSPRLFDSLMYEAYNSENRSFYRPSDAYAFRLAGVKVSPDIGN